MLLALLPWVILSKAQAMSTLDSSKYFTDPKTKAPTTEHGNWVMGWKAQADGGWKLAWSVASDVPAPKS